MKQKIIVGIDWGGTLLKIGFFDQSAKPIFKKSVAAKNFSSPGSFFKALKACISDSVFQAKLRLSDIAAFGVGIPGMIDVQKGFIYYLPNIRGWQNIPFKRYFEQELDKPVFIDNDANAMAQAELSAGSAQGVQTAVCLTLGTGVGFGLIIHGQVFRGRSSAAEGGHVPILYNGAKCGCGAQGCIETFIGSIGFMREVNRFIRKQRTILRSQNDVTPHDVYQAALAKDALACSLWDYYGEMLGVYCAGLINIFNPERIVLGGGLSGAFSVFKGSLRETVRARTMRPLASQVRFVLARFKEDAGIVGAFFLARQGLDL